MITINIHTRRHATADAKTGDARMFPSYTLADLKRWLTDPNVPEATKEKARIEIAAREAGASQTKVTPQIEGGRIMPKVGRL